MRMQRIAIAIGVILAGCTVSPSRIKPASAIAAKTAPPIEVPAASALDESSSYTYELLTPEQTKLAQVFDDSRRTYLTFEVQVPLGLLIFDESGKPVTFTVGERTVIVAGVRAGLLVRTPTRSSYAQAPKRAALARVQSTEQAGEETASWLPAELAAARAEILRAQARLTGLSAELDKAARGEPSASMAQLRSEIEEIQTAINGVTAILLRAHFASGSALLALSAEAKTAILAAATRADEVEIRGGTDNSGPLAVNALLAKERAESMRRVLIEGGIAADKLHTNSSQGEYIASNATAAGRAQNRRVDVIFANHPQDATPVTMNEASTKEDEQEPHGER
jgi:OmpA-OmpF porin, OOP family